MRRAGRPLGAAGARLGYRPTAWRGRPPPPMGAVGRATRAGRRAAARARKEQRCSPLATSHSAALPQVLQDFFFFQGASSFSLRWLLLFIMSSVPTSEPLAIFLDVGGVPEIEL